MTPISQFYRFDIKSILLLFTAILICIAFNSCKAIDYSSNEQKTSILTGRYFQKPGIMSNCKYSFLTGNLDINSDTSFAYTWEFDIADNNGYTQGKIVNSDGKYYLFSSLDEIIKRNKSIDKNGIYAVEVIDITDNKLIGANCTSLIEGDIVEQVSANLNGICIFNDTIIDAIKIESIGFDSFEFSPKNYSMNSVTIELVERGTRLLFSGEELQVKKEIIIVKSKHHEMMFRKID